MARIRPLDIHGLSPSVRVVLGRHLQQHNVRLTHSTATLAYSLVSLETYLQWQPLYEELENLLGKRTARFYGLALAQAIESPLCVAFFWKRIIDSGENPETAALSREEQNLIDFATSLAKFNGHIADHVYNAIAVRYAEKDLVLLTAFSGLMVASSIFNNVFEIDLDEELGEYQIPMRYVRQVSSR